MPNSPQYTHGQAPLAAELATHGGLKPVHGGVGGVVHTYGPDIWDDVGLVVAADSVKLAPQSYRLLSITGANSGAIQGAGGLTPGDVYFVVFTIFSIAALGGGARIGNTGVAITDLGRVGGFLTVDGGGNVFIKRFAGITDIIIGNVSARKVLS